jgi:hypothetical protein
MKSKLFIYWIICLLFLIYGIMPVKIPVKNPVIKRKNEIVVIHQECTCCPDFDIIKGSLLLPLEFQYLGTNEITVTGNHPFNYSKNETNNFFLVASGEFLFEGEVVGIDSVNGCNKRPIFRVDKWSLAKYYPKFWMFSKVYFILYLFILPLFLLFLIVETIKAIKNYESK